MMDADEVIIRNSPTKYGILFISGLIFCVLGIWLLKIDYSNFWSSLAHQVATIEKGWIFAFGIVFFGTCTGISLIGLLDRRIQVHLTKDYLFYRQNQIFSPYSYLTKHKIAWSDIDYLYLKSMSIKQIPALDYACIQLSDHARRPHKKNWNPLSKINSGIIGSDMYISVSDYDQSPFKVIAAMKDFHARFK